MAQDVQPLQTVQVPLGSRSYDIVIGPGLVDDLAEYLAPVIRDGRLHVVTDQNVFDLYKNRLTNLDRDISVTVLPPGEAQKSFGVLQKLLNDMFEQKFERNDTVVAFGGGVIGDLTGFAASIYKRGCRFVQIPTTLLAQVDSSVGGKTAINVEQGKNLVGAFYQPDLVLADTNVLSTLPDRELKAGYAEVLKYGLLGDAAFFDWLESNGQKVLSLDPNALSHAIAVSCRAKAQIVGEDEMERGKRALLNLGHTFAHALEAEAGYDGDLLHGEAVCAGMEMAFDFCARQGICSQTDLHRLQAHLKSVSMPMIADMRPYLAEPARLLGHMRQDKKNEGGGLTLILTRAIGEAYVDKSADPDLVFNYLSDLKKSYV